ncbi:helix-turn-helix transcriptional regulator [Campylobacter troglodytis]|uniref:helix-turn-helix transcriptional regulator n=1 Tax=Campylobacter troglodytis TaxID=654363 RepID=UPI0011586B31|nr:helix-turn-helix transcriptional regulator [Campylobacter troglodytis]TQR60873.1 AraC family transcriptional regulator [Campylobacter troglodytis]
MQTLHLPNDLARLKNTHYKRFNTASFAKFTQQKSSFSKLVHFANNAIVFVKSGSKIMHTQNQAYEVFENEALFLKAGPYTLSNIALNDGNYEAFLFFFDNAFLVSLMQKHHKIFAKNTTKTTQGLKTNALKTKDKELNHILEGFGLYFKENTQIFEPLINLKFEEIFMHLALKNATFNAFLQEIVSSLHLEYDKLFALCELDFITVGEMAKLVRTDLSSFSKSFKQSFKLSPKQYLDERRFEKAKSMLSFSQANINEVCHNVGFSSASWFIKRFKERYGLTPKQFQKTSIFSQKTSTN